MKRLRVRGIELNVEQFGGPADGPPLVLLHGFTGSVESWRPLASRIGEEFRPIAIDLVGHGRSDAPTDPARYRVEECVADVLEVLDRLRLERVHLLGYSMGGRVALPFALAAPERVEALILESASPGLADLEERAARVASDRALADAIEGEGLAAFVDHWERIPLFASQAQLPAETRARQRAQRLASKPPGLANSLRGLGAGVAAPLHDRLGELRTPTLMVVGEEDGKYCEIGREMVAAIPQARLEVVPGAGHAVHLERPDAFGRVVTEFLREIDAIRVA